MGHAYIGIGCADDSVIIKCSIQRITVAQIDRLSLKLHYHSGQKSIVLTKNPGSNGSRRILLKHIQ